MITTKIQTHSRLLSGIFSNQRNLMYFYSIRWDKIYEDIEDYLITDGKAAIDLIVRI